MKKEFIAITVAYLIGISSFVVQWNSDSSQPLKGLQVVAVSLCIVLLVYVISVTTNKKAKILTIPSIVLAGWGGFKFLFLVVVMILPFLIGGHAP